MNLADIICAGRVEAQSLTRPYVIAEVGVNHEGSMDTAKLLIEKAVEGGAHGVKFQTYKAHTLAAKDSPAYWDTSKEPIDSQYKLFSKHDKFWKAEMEELCRVCESFGVEFMSTPFDFESVEFLEPLMSVYKVSSSDITNKPLIRRICRQQKPILLSTGASNLSEIARAVSWIEEANIPVALLHCVLNYPTPDNHAALGQIVGLGKEFPNLAVGYSDHTLPGDMSNLLFSSLLGAVIIEKHFTHDKSLPGNDHYHAMNANDLASFWNKFDRVEAVIGEYGVSCLDEEQIARRNARRSLVIGCDVNAGDVLEEEMLIPKRPATGISAHQIDDVIGRKLKTSLKADAILQWEFLE